MRRRGRTDSRTQQIAALRAGETFSAARFIPAPVSPDEIKAGKRELSRLLSPAIARARQSSGDSYQLATIHGWTRDHDAVICAVVRRDDPVDL